MKIKTGLSDDTRCPKCGGPLDFPNRERLTSRVGSFSALALALALVGGALHAYSVELWPWVLYVCAGFVLSQAGLKWMDRNIAACYACIRQEDAKTTAAIASRSSISKELSAASQEGKGTLQ